MNLPLNHNYFEAPEPEWDVLLSSIEVRGAIPMTFERVGNRLRCASKVEDVTTGEPTTIYFEVGIPPWQSSWDAEQFVLATAERFYLHEVREQFYVNGARNYIPNHEH